MSDAETIANENGWVIISYKLPTHPSRSRVHVWRKLKKIGALYYQQGVAMLPASEHFVDFMKELKSEVTVFGGEAVLARFSFMDASDNQNAIEKFNTGLSREYSDIYDTVSKIHNELENSRKSNLLSLAYLDERLTLIIKLKKSYEKIKVRDYFKVRLHERVEEQIDFLLQTVQRYHAEINTSSN